VTLFDLLCDHPFDEDEGVLFSVDGSMTLGETRRRVEELARTFDVGPGRAIAVQLPNGPELLCAMFAVWSREAVFVPVNDRMPAAEVDSILAATGACGIVDRNVDRVLGPLRGSGRRQGPPTPNLIPVSMALNAGIYNCLFGLRAGSSLVIMDRFTPEEFAVLVDRFQIRSTVLPPAAMVMLADSGVDSLAPLRYVRSITAPLSPLQAQRFMARFGCFVLNRYGQAEMGEVIGWTAAYAREHPERLGAAGRPLPGVAVRVDAEGHLLVRPPSAALGLDERIDDEGYIDTGDVATIDDAGFVWIEGRVSDLINRGGNKVFPDAVEEVLRLHPSVVDVAVVGVPDVRLGEVPVAFVVGSDIDEAALLSHCREHLIPYKVPVEIIPIDELPRNEIGKVLRRELVQRRSVNP